MTLFLQQYLASQGGVSILCNEMQNYPISSRQILSINSTVEVYYTDKSIYRCSVFTDGIRFFIQASRNNNLDVGNIFARYIAVCVN